MKNKIWKRIGAVAACLALVLTAGFVMTACGETPANIYATDYVIEDWGIKGKETDFENTKDFKLEAISGEENAYKAVGTPLAVSAAQAAAWGCQKGDHIVIVSVKMELKSDLKTGWVSVADKDKAFGAEVESKQYAGTEGVKEYLLGVEGAGIADHTATPVWRIEVTAPVAEGETPVTVAYTIDFTEMLEELAEANA